MTDPAVQTCMLFELAVAGGYYLAVITLVRQSRSLYLTSRSPECVFTVTSTTGKEPLN